MTAAICLMVKRLLHCVCNDVRIVQVPVITREVWPRQSTHLIEDCFTTFAMTVVLFSFPSLRRSLRLWQSPNRMSKSNQGQLPTITTSGLHSITISLFHSFTPSRFHFFREVVFRDTVNSVFTTSLFHAFTPSLLHALTPSLLHDFTPSRLHHFTPNYKSQNNLSSRK